MNWDILWGVIAAIGVAFGGYLLTRLLKQREAADRRYDEVRRDDGDDHQWGGEGSDIGPGGGDG